MVDDLIFNVARRRVREISEELPHPDIATHFSVDGEGRGLIDIFHQGDLIGQEIIETHTSWRGKDRLFAYREVLRKKIRLVVMAPRADATKVRMMMLELNNWWMFYYMVYGYDSQGRLVRVLQPSSPERDMPYIA